MNNYRQSTAKALGFEVKNKMNELGRFDNYFIGDKWECRVQEWQPDKDANQREMIEDWLIEQGWSIKIRYAYLGPPGYQWNVEFYKYVPPPKVFIKHSGDGKSKSLAFEKAWEEYTNNK